MSGQWNRIRNRTDILGTSRRRSGTEYNLSLWFRGRDLAAVSAGIGDRSFYRPDIAFASAPRRHPIQVVARYPPLLPRLPRPHALKLRQAIPWGVFLPSPPSQPSGDKRQRYDRPLTQGQS